jgi:hypothetical protein
VAVVLAKACVMLVQRVPGTGVLQRRPVGRAPRRPAARSSPLCASPAASTASDLLVLPAALLVVGALNAGAVLLVMAAVGRAEQPGGHGLLRGTAANVA